MPDKHPEPKAAERQVDTVDESNQPTIEQDLSDERSSQRATIDTNMSDVMLASDGTLAAPSFRPPVKPRPPRASDAVQALAPGEVIGDFEMEKVLGQGAFGVVYLARQLSLDRKVALKVAANEGSEGRTMARLEHDHIVQVFSESVNDAGTLRLLCMQLVLGASLEGVIHNLHRGADRPKWSGKDYLAIVESRAQAADVLDTSALRDREQLAGYDAVQTTAWVGARLAEAVDYAHRQGVLHRDIKPANVLVNQYGRPMLADFNISFRSFEEGAAPDSTFGGTMAFMAPEHLDAFDPSSGASPAEVDERSDLYSLSIVIHELLTGSRPFVDPKRDASRTEFIRTLSTSRRESPPPLEEEPPSARKTLLRTVSKSLQGNKEDRHQCGAELAAALDGCRELQTVERDLPTPSWYARGAWKAPFWWLVLLAVGPQIIGSVVNISYNLFEIMGYLSPAQQDLFMNWLVPCYNSIAYPALIAIGVIASAPVYITWNKLASAELVDEQEVGRARRRAVSLPYWMLAIAAAGWLPGGLLFPVMLDMMLDDPVSLNVYAHFITSFTLSGLIAVAYSFCGLQFLLLQVLYPRLWSDASHYRQKAAAELAGTPWRLWLINILSGAIPAVAAVVIGLMIVFLLRAGGDHGEAVRLLILQVSLVLLGGLGREITTAATSRMASAYTALVGNRSSTH